MAEYNRIIADGRDRFKKSDGYAQQVQEIKKVAEEKYQQLVQKEPVLLKRVLLRIRCKLEIRKQLNQLSSQKNLHLAQNY